MISYREEVMANNHENDAGHDYDEGNQEDNEDDLIRCS